MSAIIDFLSMVFVATGTFFCFTAVIGLLRFPDTYTRLHAGTKGLTGGAVLILLGVMPMAQTIENTVKILLILTFFLATNPLGSHAIARARRKHLKRCKPRKEKI